MLKKIKRKNPLSHPPHLPPLHLPHQIRNKEERLI